MSKTFRLAVVDDHPVVRRGIVETLSDEADMEVVAQGADATDAVRIAEDLGPDLMLVDVSMPGGGLEALERIKRARPDVRCAMLSVREDLQTVRSALAAGARGYISKGVDGQELVSSIRRMLAGGSFVSPDLAARLLAIDPSGEVRVADGRARSQQINLTEREDQIFRLLGSGLSNLEIGQKLGLTENTVKHYITPLLHKLGVRNRTEAALLARDGAVGEV